MGLPTARTDLTQTFLLFHLQLTIWTRGIVTFRDSNLVWFAHKLKSRLGINKSRNRLYDVVYHNRKCAKRLSLHEASGF